MSRFTDHGKEALTKIMGVKSGRHSRQNNAANNLYFSRQIIYVFICVDTYNNVHSCLYMHVYAHIHIRKYIYV